MLIVYLDMQVRQQPPSNACAFFICIDMIVFGLQLNCKVSAFTYFIVNVYN
jgi:hypothetical protein